MGTMISLATAGMTPLDAGNGDDNVTGGAGNDTINGGAGFDLAWYDDATSGVTVNLTTGTGRSTVNDEAGIGIDNLVSIEGVTGSSFADVLTGNAASNWLDGDGGDDWISGGGEDWLLGWDGNDQLFGGAHNDELYGENGDDTLTGGTGADLLTGGAGSDVFQDTKLGLNGDSITDFSTGDRIIISDATLTGFTFSLTGNTLTYTGGSLTLLSAPVKGTIVVTSATGGGVQLAITQCPTFSTISTAMAGVMYCGAAARAN